MMLPIGCNSTHFWGLHIYLNIITGTSEAILRGVN